MFVINNLDKTNRNEFLDRIDEIEKKIRKKIKKHIISYIRYHNPEGKNERLSEIIIEEIRKEVGDIIFKGLKKEPSKVNEFIKEKYSE